jgi:CheY-like chemotaxis protein
MIITEDEDLLETLLTGLRREGHLAIVVSDPDPAIDKITEHRPDLLLLDVNGPKSRAAAFDLAREIQRSEAVPGLPVIMLCSGNEDFPFSFRPQDLDSRWFPVSAIVEKPVDISLLSGKISELLAKTGGKHGTGRAT